MRTEPIRDFSNAFRSGDPREGSDRHGPEDPSRPGPRSAGDACRPSSWTDVVSRGVELGYQVIEDQIRLGQRVASGRNDRPYDFARMGDDAWEVTERAVRYYTEMSNLWMQFLTGMSWLGPWAGGPWGRPPGRHREEHEPWRDESGWRRVAVALAVDSLQPVSVELDLHTPGDLHVHLATFGLVSAEGHPPLTGVAFEPGAVSDGVRLRLRVPDDQPASLYTGAVFDQRSGQPQGTLSVSISGRD